MSILSTLTFVNVPYALDVRSKYIEMLEKQRSLINVVLDGGTIHNPKQKAFFAADNVYMLKLRYHLAKFQINDQPQLVLGSDRDEINKTFYKFIQAVREGELDEQLLACSKKLSDMRKKNDDEETQLDIAA